MFYITARPKLHVFDGGLACPASGSVLGERGEPLCGCRMRVITLLLGAQPVNFAHRPRPRRRLAAAGHRGL